MENRDKRDILASETIEVLMIANGSSDLIETSVKEKNRFSGFECEEM
jgi:hypothetical protein